MAQEERSLYNKFQGKHGRTPGVYLDEVERRQLEDYRAAIESREPDYEHLDIGYSPIVPLDMVPDNSYSNPSAARDPQDVAPVVTVVNEVFEEPTVVARTSANYVDELANANAVRAAGAPAGAPAGAYDDGGEGGPDLKHPEKAVSTTGTDLSANDSPTMAPENRPAERKATKKATAKKTAAESTAKKSTTKKVS